MLKNIFLLTLCAFFASLLSAQAIERKKAMGGYRYTQADKKLSLNQLGKILQSDAEAYPVFQSGKSQNGVGAVIGGIGGFLVGWPLGTALGGGTPNWKLAGIGAGLIVVSIPISTGAAKKMNRAVDMYNQKLGTGAVQRAAPELVLGANGVGVTWRF